MKAVIFDKPGLENLKVEDVPIPEVKEGEVLIKVMMAGVNPIDYFVVTGSRKAEPLPHIPGAEFAGVVESIGPNVTNVQRGNRVVVYPRLFDGTCDMCLVFKEMLCRNGGVIGVSCNGGFAEYVKVPSGNVFKVDEGMDWELAASMPVSALTAYHALNSASLSLNNYVVVVGASGNTGMFATQLARLVFGAKVIGVSRKKWVERFGAFMAVEKEQALEKVKEVTNGRMVDVVIDPLGAETFLNSLELLRPNGKLVTYGVLTGSNVELPISKIYNQQLSIVGTTGGTRRELADLLNQYKWLQVKTWKKFKLEEAKTAIESLSSPERDGRILIDLTTQ